MISGACQAGVLERLYSYGTMRIVMWAIFYHLLLIGVSRLLISLTRLSIFLFGASLFILNESNSILSYLLELTDKHNITFAGNIYINVDAGNIK